MITPLTALIRAHRSIRRFTSQPLDDELLNSILETGTRAATSGNMQFYSVIVSRNAEQKQKLYEAHGRQEMILQAQAVLCICADQRRMQAWMEANGAQYEGGNLIGFLRGVVDATILAQNIALAAEAEGLGICYMGTTLSANDKIAEILKLPKNVFPVTSLVVGWPDENPRKRDRLPIEAIVHQETYDENKIEKITEHYAARDRDAWERLKNRPEVADLVAQGKIQNAAQIYSHWKYAAADLEQYSKNIAEALKSRWGIRF